MIWHSLKFENCYDYIYWQNLKSIGKYSRSYKIFVTNLYLVRKLVYGMNSHLKFVIMSNGIKRSMYWVGN